MNKHVAWTANVPGVGELEERDPGQYQGRHRRSISNMYGEAFYERWMIRRSNGDWRFV